MRSFDEIIQIVLDMQRRQGPTIRAMREVLDRYDGDWVIPIPSVASEPTLPPLTPALIGEAVDSMATRACSVRPTTTSPALKASRDTGAGSRLYAHRREQIIAATYHNSKWILGRRRFYRQLAAYHTGSLVVVPNFVTSMPQIEVRDPLSTFVEPQAHEQLRPPRYAAFVTRHSADDLRKRFPKVRQENGGPIPTTDMTMMWDTVEWYDEDQLVFGLVGPVIDQTQSYYPVGGQRGTWMQLSPVYPNKTDFIPVVVPTNVSLGKIASRIGSMVGNVDLQAKMMALDIMAQEKAIFPDMYAIGRQSGQPMIIGGRWQDGREGNINLLQDIESVGMLRNTPDQRTSQVIDRLERNFRISTGLTAATGGENYSNLRTGRALGTMEGIAVDPRVQELHEISEAYMPHLNSAILSMYEAYWPDKKYSLFSGWPGSQGIVEFTPEVHIEGVYDNTVSYAVAGADVTQQTQILGSLLGTGTISRRTFRDKHPWINNPESEGQLVDEEQFEEALKQSMLQQLSQGQMPLTVAVMIRDFMAKGDDIFKAVAKADKAARELQATQAPPPQEGQVGAPESMPGLAGGPQMMQQPPAPEQQPQPQIEVPGDVSRMRQLMSVMQQPATQPSPTAAGV